MFAIYLLRSIYIFATYLQGANLFKSIIFRPVLKFADSWKIAINCHEFAAENMIIDTNDEDNNNNYNNNNDDDDGE